MEVVKTISPLIIHTNERTPISTEVYFAVRKWYVDRDMHSSTNFNIRGTVVFVVKACKLVNDKLVDIAGVSPIVAEYKEITFRNIFGEMTINAFYDAIPQLTIDQIHYKSQTEPGTYWGLTENDLEIVEIPN